MATIDKPHRLRYVRNLLLVAIAGLLTAFWIIVPAVQAGQVLHPARQAVCCVSPADFDLDFEEVLLEASDGVALEPKTFWELEGVAHTGGLWGEPEYAERVLAFLDGALK